MSYWCCLCISRSTLYFVRECVILCTIFKTFDACNVCKFTIIIIITIIIIFKMGVCEAREHGDFSCYQDKRILKKHLNKIFKTRFS